MQDLLLTSAALLEQSFFLSLTYIHLCQGMDTGGKKGIYEALKEVEASSNSCHRWAPQTMWSLCVTLHARLSFPFLLCVCKLGLDFSQAIISQSKPKSGKMCHTKLPAKHSPEGTRGQFLMRTRRRGEERDCKDFWKHPPLKTSHPHPREKLSKTMN